jgi:hypothetical protein
MKSLTSIAAKGSKPGKNDLNLSDATILSGKSAVYLLYNRNSDFEKLGETSRPTLGERRVMKGFIKSTVVGLIVFALSFSPALARLVNAGGINFEGISATDSRHQAKGIMFDFSFGGPDGYKKKSAFKEVYKNNFAGVDWQLCRG